MLRCSTLGGPPPRTATPFDVTGEQYLGFVSERAGDGGESPLTAGVAGGSAQRRYDKLAAKDAEARAEARTRSIVVVVGLTLAAGAAVFGATQGANVAYARWVESQPALAGSSKTEIFTVQLAAIIAGVAMLAAFSTLARAAWGRRQTTEAYRVGADGERGAADALKPLADVGWIVLHDRRVPNGKENVDHIAVGPAGIAVVETKNWSGKVVASAETLRRNGRDAQAALDQVLRQVAAVRETGVAGDDEQIRPIIYVHRAQIERRGSRRRPARPRGVRICGPRELLAAVSDGPALLSPERVSEIAIALSKAMPPA